MSNGRLNKTFWISGTHTSLIIVERFYVIRVSLHMHKQYSIRWCTIAWIEKKTGIIICRQLFQTKIHLIIFFQFYFTFSSNITTVYGSCFYKSSWNLNASTGKQPAMNVSTGLFTIVAAAWRSKKIWRPSSCINSCQL